MNSRENEALKTATAYAKNGDLERAIESLKALVARNPKHEIATGMLASIYAQLDMRDRAIEYFQRTLTINPANPLARLQLGQLQLSAGRPLEALATWKPSVDDPQDFVARFHSGLALLQLQRPQEARSMFEAAAQRMPKDHALYAQLQDLLHAAGR